MTSEVTDQNRTVALVTGGAVGIGRDIAIRLAEDGADVAFTYLSHAPDDTLAAIQALGRRAHAIKVDATDPDAVNAAVREVVQQLGGVGVLVNNAGGLVGRVPLAEMSAQHWHRVLDVNLSSAFFFLQATAPHMPAGGRVVNIGSLAGDNGGSAGAGAYATAKAGLAGLTRAAAKEFAPAGITVNAVAPGFIDQTPFHETFSTPAAVEAMTKSTAVGRPGAPSEVAHAVSFLASTRAGFITGAVLDLNGGTYFT
ncbi:SDR family oxidoreductase [Terrabacter terrae]|uniref:SDR family oxidoreductase n=1 Tax=Terrabacter terrae TaxID=318434 RepID=A0ABN1ZPF5_9MICO